MSRSVVAWAMLLAPVVAQAQQPSQPSAKEDTLDTTWLTPQSVAVGYLRPRQILTAENAELLPREIFDAAAKKYLGVEAVNIESITAVCEPLQGQQPLIAAVVKCTKPLTLAGLSPELTSHTQPAELNGMPYLKSRDANAPSFYLHDKTTLIVATEPMLQKLLQQAKEPITSPLIAEVKDRAATDDLYIAVDVKSIRPQIDAALAEMLAQMLPALNQRYLGALDLIRSAEFSLNLSHPAPPLLTVYANDERSAQGLAQLIEEGVADVRAQMAAIMAMNPSDDPVEQAMMAYSVRSADRTLEALKPVRDGDKLTFFPSDPNDPNQTAAQMQQAAVVGMLVALLLPAVQAAREAARRNDTLARLRDFAIAMQNHHDTKGKFPAHASYDADGKPLLSWRVHLLPFMEEVELYREFHLDEPWDSEHNKQLIAKMPEAFQSSSSPLNRAEGKTLFVAPIGPGYVMDGTKDGVGMRGIPDGSSKTIVIVEADPDKAVIWTKPDDLQVDLENPAAGLGKLRQGVFMAAFVDGHAATVSTSIDPDIIKALFTRNGREVIQQDLNP